MDTKKRKIIYIPISFVLIAIIICIIIIASNKNNTLDSSDSNLDNNIFSNSTVFQASNSIGGRVNTDNLYIDDKPVSLNQTLTSKYSLGYLLKYKINENTPISEYKVNIDDYINQNKPNGTGIWITDANLLEGNKPSRDTILDILKDFGLSYSINSNGFLEKNNSSVDIARKINKIIESDKLIIIGFSPIYYTYFNNMNNTVSGCDLDNTFVSFEPIENIYSYIIRGNCDTDELQEIINQILIDID